MKKITIILLISVSVTSCKKEKEINVQYITDKFNETIENIDKVQYDVQNVMTFSDGNVWNNKGFAVLEKETSDTVFGFSFYGIRNDINKSSIYKDGIGFQISNSKRKFEQEKGGLHFLGSPGGQMIYRDFFKLDSVYKKVVFSETDSTYLLTYTFEDDLENKITDKTKTIELSKNNFLPKKVVNSLQPDFGNKQTVEFIFDNFKINESIDKSVNSYIEELNEYEQIIEEKPKPNPLLKKSLPKFILTDLFDEKNKVNIDTDKLTLIDFWEVWCGWCIKSFPKVEEIKNKYENDLNVIGIVSQDIENARKLVEKKETTFLNLIGNKELNQTFSVNSWPRYFLVDQNEIIQEEYYGFSDQIEKDIKKLNNK
ncbi:TlpA family protein disulfide reductase [Luteirhabdus pelagi]|uniref:TlpA family protein disulfide reductase n=1 Tax=Luteirhabdus pelagi TaxID=2792783 RepID=UPI00193A0CDE|nr:TlpA disulfide reductase family protein [Luteirhabdus pelagi]